MSMTLLYPLGALVVAALLFVLVRGVFGRGEELPPLPRGTTPTSLPARDVGARDIAEVRFTVTARGYKMEEVDWVLARLAARIGELEARVETAETAAGDGSVPARVLDEGQ